MHTSLNRASIEAYSDCIQSLMPAPSSSLERAATLVKPWCRLTVNILSFPRVEESKTPANNTTTFRQTRRPLLPPANQTHTYRQTELPLLLPLLETLVHTQQQRPCT